MIWTAARKGQSCPVCSHVFAADEPMALLTARRLKRCAICVMPATPDWDAVHREIEARRAIQTGEDVTNIRHTFDRVAPGSLNEALKNFGIKGVRRSKVKPYAEVADDPDVMRTGGGE